MLTIPILEKKKEDTYHAWNAVKIDGTWYLMDATWDAGSVGENKLFTRNVEDYSYFLIDPGVFKETYTPELKKMASYEILKIRSVS